MLCKITSAYEVAANENTINPELIATIEMIPIIIFEFMLLLFLIKIILLNDPHKI